jgi:hypothetical protein
MQHTDVRTPSPVPGSGPQDARHEDARREDEARAQGTQEHGLREAVRGAPRSRGRDNLEPGDGEGRGSAMVWGCATAILSVLLLLAAASQQLLKASTRTRAYTHAARRGAAMAHRAGVRVVGGKQRAS